MAEGMSSDIPKFDGKRISPIFKCNNVSYAFESWLDIPKFDGKRISPIFK